MDPDTEGPEDEASGTFLRGDTTGGTLRGCVNASGNHTHQNRVSDAYVPFLIASDLILV